MAAASAVPGLDLSAMLQDPELKKEAPEVKPLEDKLSSVTPEDAAASTPAEAKFEFRSLLSDEQREAIKQAAPTIAEKMVKDYEQIINFGEPVLEKMNQSSISMLDEQKNIKIPEADQIVNNLLREMDGYNARYRNVKMEDLTQKIKKFFGGAKYSIETMIRDAKPISERLNEAEVKLREMELNLGDNSKRARKLHDQTLETMDEVVGVLAVLEEVSTYLHAKFDRVDAALQAAVGDEAIIDFDGQKYSVNEFRELHADLAQGIGEIEKSWFSWRQQFFLGYASAPTLRNLIMVSAGMQRQLHGFRTQGIPSARRGLAQWQQAALARNSAKLGQSFQEGTNKLLQGSFEASAIAVDEVARAAQAPLISEETVFAVIDSVKKQAQSIVDADKWGRDMRARNIEALERGEKEITIADEEGRRKLVANAVSSARGDASAKSDTSSSNSNDILGKLGVKK